ncbi:tripartite tricarboxylate transporter TctB family protein [Flintibacter muris]|uniref:tripartite tricarboxylate transporter TctB family protein n=1 Tax=Flintibacter muris TaxID=2941327 RepID=UPI00203AB76E|nr:tripartite tricarboxylate transporter TctB family protein [Flintibacter muris]
MKKGNLVLAAICAVLGIGVIAMASGYPKAADYGTGVPGPGLWPIVISIVLLACTAILLFRTLKMPPEKDSKIELWTTGTRRVYLTMGILMVYLLLLPFLGFIIATFVLELIFIQWFAKKNPVITVVIAAAITMVVYCAFRFLLNVPVHTFGIFTI